MSRTDWPWNTVVGLEIAPSVGAVYTTDDIVVEGADDIRQYVREDSDDSSYGVVRFPYLGPRSIRVIIDERDPDVPAGCKPTTWRFVLGDFSLP